MSRTISRYREAKGLPQSQYYSQPTTKEFWRAEIDDLKKLQESLEAKNKNLSGEDLSSLGMREIKQLERQLKAGIDHIRSRKQRDLQEENACLKRKPILAENLSTWNIEGYIWIKKKDGAIKR
ncbi:Agamous-like MADS-box protein AGL6 [Acorus calamus]|uniref:Agamous-like MADS-box protein AGL6 n=1 Tax=Acorus calamus TaxID=4465 RepID=A0AAV9C079_ACOCL|nr:Agamous-like MADS-box protein AGL6 [Acorus calamus]